jgi:hypothetical protein
MQRYRIGKKQKRAILETATGREYLVFPQSNTEHVALFLEWLNNHEQTKNNNMNKEQIEQLKKRIAKVCDEFMTPIPDKLIIQGHEVTNDNGRIRIKNGELGFMWLNELRGLYISMSKYHVEAVKFQAITLTTDEIKSIIEWDKW